MKSKFFTAISISMVLLNICFVGCKTGLTEEYIEPITLTFFNVDLNKDMNFDNEVAKKITELTGVTLKIIHPVQGDSQAISLMIASGEYPDLIYAKEETSKLIEADAIIKLDDYIEKKGDNIKALYGNQLNMLRASGSNPYIYTLGSCVASDELVNPSGIMQIQHDALKELGYPKVKNIYDVERVISEYISKNPKTEDGLDRIGLSLMASDWRWLITCGNIASAVIAIPDDGQYSVNSETGEAIYKFIIPEIKEYFKWLNHMNDIGLLDPESFTQNEDVYKAKIASGRVIALSDQHWNYAEAEQALKDSGRDGATYAKLPILLDENKYKDNTLKNSGMKGNWGISISETCENKERAFEFLDWMASDEAQVLINWGIEGVHYFYNSEGKREFYPEYKKFTGTYGEFESTENDMVESGIGYYTYPFPQREYGEVDSTGNPYTNITLESIKNNYTEAEKETLEAFGIETWSELFTSPEELGISRHGQVWQYYIEPESEMGKIQKKADEYCQQAITKAILGKPEDFDRAWDEIQQTLKDYDIDKLNQEMTKFIQEKIGK